MSVDAVDTFATAATASTAAATNATALAREAAALAETADARETEASSLATSAGTLEQDAETTQTRFDEANSAASAPDVEETNVTLIAAAAAGSVAFLAIAFAAYRLRGRLSRRNAAGGSGPPKSRSRGNRFGGFSALQTSKNDTAPSGAETSTPMPPPAAARYAAPSQAPSKNDTAPSGAETSTPIPPPAAARYAAPLQPPSGTPLPPSQGTLVSPTERGLADFPPGSPHAPAAAQAAAQTPPSSFQPRWTSAPTPTPIQGHMPVHGQTPVQGQAPTQAPVQAPASPFQHLPFPTPNQNEATPGYSPPTAFAAFGDGTPGGPSTPPTETRQVPHSVRAVISTPFGANADSMPRDPPYGVRRVVR